MLLSQISKLKEIGLLSLDVSPMSLELIVYHNVHVTQSIQRALSAGGEGGAGGLSLIYLYISVSLNFALINDQKYVVTTT